MLEQCSRSERIGSRGGQFDGEWQSFQPLHNGGYRRSVPLGEDEMRPCGLGSDLEELNSGKGRELEGCGWGQGGRHC
jgi:hypothetical protein